MYTDCETAVICHVRLPSFSLLLSSVFLFTNCDRVCDTDDFSQCQLTDGQRAWTNSCAENTGLRFRSASGYERTYRVTHLLDIDNGGGGGKSSFCPS